MKKTKQDEINEGHARFSPSNSSRWLHCSKSMLLEEKYERGESEYAQRGTSLHSAAEAILKGEELKDEYDGYKPTEDDLSLTVIPYVEYILGLEADLKMIEQRVVVVKDECHGTADCIAYDSKSKTLHVVDLKCGQGVMVYAKDNTQMQIYALGALKLLKNQDLEIEKVVTHVVQPGIDNYGTEEVSFEKLQALEQRIIMVIEMVNSGHGDFAPSDNACRWCPHKIDCPALNEIANRAAMDDFADESLSEKMKMVPALKHFIKAIEDQSLETLQQGKDLPGFKLVRGKGQRKWSDEKKIEEFLTGLTIDPGLTHSKPKLLTVAQLEKALKREYGAKNLPDIAQFVTKNEGAPKVAPIESPKKAIDKTEDAKEAFADID